MTARRLVLACLVTAFSLVAVPVGARSHQVRGELLREHHCPACGKTHGACLGYVVDHIESLCDGGQDESGNMQW